VNFLYNAPAQFSMPLAFFVSWLVSVLDSGAKSRGVKLAFEAQLLRSQTGIGAAVSSSH